MHELTAFALSWLLTYLVHSSLLLGGVFLAVRISGIRSGALQSGLWRAALFGAVLTAMLQVILATSPVQGHVLMPAGRPAAARYVTKDATVPPLRAPVRSGSESPVGSGAVIHGKDVAPGTDSLPATPPARNSGPSMVEVAVTWLEGNWPWLVLAVWAALALVFLLRLGRSVLSSLRTLDGRRHLREGPALDILQALCREAGLRRCPRLSVCASLDGPVSLPNGEICLPTWTLEQLAPGQFRAMLAHELAHCRRHDPLWQLAGNILGAVLFLQPLNRLARAGAAASAELACDDWAAIHTGDRRALAECLFECLSRTGTRASTALGSAMALPGSELTRRVGRLVSGIQLFNGVLGMKARIGIFSVLVSLAILAPGFGVTASLAADEPASAASPLSPASPASPASAVEAARAQAAEAANQAAEAREQAAAEVGSQNEEMHKAAEAMRKQAVAERRQAQAAARQMQAAALEEQGHAHAGSHNHISITQNNHDTDISFEESGLSVKMHADGPFAFNAAENDLASLGAGGRLEMMVTQGDSTRRVVFTNDGGKGIDHAYYVNGASRPFGAQARQWLAGILPEILRETALDAKARIARILKQGGPDAVLAEIGKIQGGYARSVYIRDFAGAGPLKRGIVDKLIALTGPIDSGYEKEQALIGLYRSQQLKGAQLSALLKAGTGIDSGYEKSQLLQTVAAQMPLDKATVQAYLGMAGSVHSSYEMRMALDALLGRSGLPGNALVDVMTMAAAHMHSSYDLRMTLGNAAAQVDGSATAAKAYCRSAGRIGSSYDKRMALDELVRTAKLDDAGYLCVLETAAGIGSDYDKSTLLVSVAGRMPNSAALKAKYRDVAKGIGSDYDRKQAERALNAD